MIANQGADGTNGVTISAGDIVTISLIPVAYTEAMLRADRLISVHSNSATETEVTFKSSNGSAGDDTITFTHPDNDGSNCKIIAEYFNALCGPSAINTRGGIVTVSDRQNGVVAKELLDAGVTNMAIAIA